ncbi:carboxyl-terminal processing protease [bacterium JGI 053]|nr:carboxyl-terminal processing protease [bacterium JGI 053]
MVKKLIVAVPALGALLALSPARAQTPITPALAAATFDSAWSVVDRTLWDTTVVARVWAPARDELRPRAERAKTVEELRGVLATMIARLPYSHFEVIPGEVQARLAEGSNGEGGDAGMEVRLVGERFLVTRVDSGGPAAAAGVRPGWSVDAVGGKTAAERLALLAGIPGAREPRGRQLYAWAALAPALRGTPRSRLTVRFRDGADRPVEKTLTLAARAGMAEKFGNLPSLNVQLETRRVRMADGTTLGVIRFNYWFPVILPALNAAVDSLRGVDGFVIDLRGNLGGLGAMAPGFAGHFLETADTLGVMRMRSGTLYFVANPRRVDTQARPVAPFAGPLAVLTDALTASTSEFFAGRLQQLGRAHVFGEPTAGAALPALAQKLPDGDVLMHAIADFGGPRGQRFEGLGVTPDVAAPPTRAALLAGRDPAMEAAAEWIRTARGRPAAP